MTTTIDALARIPDLQGAPVAQKTEWEVRVELAACYRLVHHFGMTDLIFTHISARVPRRHDQFLINPYGLTFDEVTASSLVKVDLEGNILDDSPYTVNKAGFTIHSAVHMARPDVECVLHTHTRAGEAVSALACGLLPISQHALQFYNRVAYHDYEGIALDLDERARLVADLGDKRVMILRNHGLLTAGRTIPEAFGLMFNLNRACEVQIAAQSTGAPLVIPPPEICEKTARQFEQGGRPSGHRAWPALLRLLDRECPEYKS